MKKLLILLTLLTMFIISGCISPTMTVKSFGVQSLGGRMTKITKTSTGGVSYRTIGRMNGKIYAYVTIYQYDDHLSLNIQINNDSRIPIQMNMFADKFILVDIKGNQYRLEFDIMSYPSGYINPSEHINFSSKSFYTSLTANQIKSAYIKIGLSGIQILTKIYDVIDNQQQ